MWPLLPTIDQRESWVSKQESQERSSGCPEVGMAWSRPYVSWGCGANRSLPWKPQHLLFFSFCTNCSLFASTLLSVIHTLHLRRSPALHPSSLPYTPCLPSPCPLTLCPPCLLGSLCLQRIFCRLSRVVSKELSAISCQFSKLGHPKPCDLKPICSLPVSQLHRIAA